MISGDLGGFGDLRLYFLGGRFGYFGGLPLGLLGIGRDFLGGDLGLMRFDLRSCVSVLDVLDVSDISDVSDVEGWRRFLSCGDVP